MQRNVLKYENYKKKRYKVMIQTLLPRSPSEASQKKRRSVKHYFGVFVYVFVAAVTNSVTVNLKGKTETFASGWISLTASHITKIYFFKC